MNASGANVLLVDVGTPKQEKWIMKYCDRMPNVDVFMALGTMIDFEYSETGTKDLAEMRNGMAVSGNQGAQASVQTLFH